MMPIIRICAALATLAATTVPAASQVPSLAGKTVQLIIGFDTGGGFDLWGRAVARHIGKHLPGNPTVVPQNMPAAGGSAPPITSTILPPRTAR
jgi:tripartite-type tricarboxylate transporter receptor subunit TctC